MELLLGEQVLYQLLVGLNKNYILKLTLHQKQAVKTTMANLFQQIQSLIFTGCFGLYQLLKKLSDSLAAKY